MSAGSSQNVIPIRVEDLEEVINPTPELVLAEFVARSIAISYLSEGKALPEARSLGIEMFQEILGDEHDITFSYVWGRIKHVLGSNDIVRAHFDTQLHSVYRILKEDLARKSQQPRH